MPGHSSVGGGGGGRRKIPWEADPPVVLPQRFVIEERLKEVERLKFRKTDFDAKIKVLSEESQRLQQQKMAITEAIEELRQGLNFKSTISAKVFFGQDAAKESDENVALQIRMLEDELHRKKIQWSKLEHDNMLTRDDISESRLRKTKCAKVSVLLEDEFKGEQERMSKVLGQSNTYSREISSLEQRHEEMLNRMEKRGSEQSEEQQELLAKLERLRQRIDKWAEEDKLDNINREVALRKTAAGFDSGVKSDNDGADARSDEQDEEKLAAAQEEEKQEREAEVLEKYASFTKAFKTLMRETGETDIRRIVDIFMQREEKNFALYHYLQRMEHSIQVEEQKLAKVSQETQQYTSKAEGAVQEGSSAYRKQLSVRDDLIKQVRELTKERKALQRSQRKWHSQIEQFLCLLFGSQFNYESQLLHETSGVSELILDVKNLLRTKTMFGSSSSQNSATSASTKAPAILITEPNALLGFAIIEQTVAEIMPAFIDSMHSTSLNNVIRNASMNKYGTLAPPVGKRNAGKDGRPKQYDVVAPELSEINPDMDSLHSGSANDGSQWKRDRLSSAASERDVSYGASSTVPFNSQTMRAKFEEEIKMLMLPRRHNAKKSIGNNLTLPTFSQNPSSPSLGADQTKTNS